MAIGWLWRWRVEFWEKPDRLWVGTSWLSVLSGGGVGMWWFLHTPTVGKGGLLLAMGATVLPLFWEKVGVVAKMSWIGMLFILLFVEYRAIDKDRRDNEIEHELSLERIGKGFAEVTKEQQDSFKRLVEQSNKEFKATTDQASSQFSATMRRAQEGMN
jgi:hypothetical protein